MFGRRRDIQIPKVPVSGDKATQSWMTAVGSMLSKYIGGGSDDRLVSAKELIDGGLAGIGTGGFLTTPPKNLTKPPKVSGLTANGAFAAIYVQWNNPSFSNYSHTELWRADIDDIGLAVLIASTAVESYIDNVGSAATKYYWARAVSDEGVKGDFNAVNGVKGTTSLEPEYVKQILTSITWKPNTTYYPFQYVRPTVENGFQYAAVDGGKSGSVEPTWPTTINATVDDGTIQWTAVPVDARIPFVLGTLEDGTPAVFMDTAYIKNASITSAKISELIADKITTGDLNADLHVLSKLWYGFNQPNGDFLDPEDNTITSGKSGFYLGVNGSNNLPVLHLNTGIANGSKSLFFDGTKLELKGDGLFDDIFVDAARFDTISTNTISYNQRVVPSDYLAESGILLNNDNYQGYLCLLEPINKSSQSGTGQNYDIHIFLGSPNPVVVSGYGFFGAASTNNLILAYDVKDKTSFLRFKDKKVSFTARIGGFVMGSGINHSITYNFVALYISGKGQISTKFGFGIRDILDSVAAGNEETLSSTVDGKTLVIKLKASQPTSPLTALIVSCIDTDNCLNYSGAGAYVQCYIFGQYTQTYGGGTPSYSYSGVVPFIKIQFNKPDYTPISSVYSEPILT